MKQIVLLAGIHFLCLTGLAMDSEEDDGYEYNYIEMHEDEKCDGALGNSTIHSDSVDVKTRDVNVQIRNSGLAGQGKNSIIVDILKNATIHGNVNIGTITINTGCNTKSFNKNSDK